jgi:hypothetical protein
MPTIYAGQRITIGDIEISADNIFLGETKVAINPYVYLDNDAYNFLNASNLLSNELISTTINTLVTDLKQYNIWDKLYAMYPLVGGTSTTCQYNLINTSSLNLAFSGSWNFNNNGISGSGTDNGVTGSNYASTGFRPLTASYDNVSKNISLGIYVETNITGGYDMGLDAGGANDLYLITRYVNNLTYFYYTSSLTVANTDAKGFYIGTISGSATNNQVIYKNGVSVASKTGGGGNIDNGGYLVIGAANQSPVASSANLYGLSFIGKGLTSTNASDLNTTVQSFATTLGRNV